ncbi:hypothetical protein BWQ96_05906 [Gracilariopsis chorda]|uniref:Uncharacterized protein n=1 Tax=Gracilariopsis chorda TaxID=448386 RepID=A0A2V3IQG1_9FLOR|nr:hypothetical protein BWQ96_05906 [Gracilariopsis chorda]|eukprot:PXF44342.1 hypothetical protein BWQ96_05906 [Gracilariopsis chorda]
MAASVRLPTRAAPVNPPSKINQTPPSTTASRTLQPRSARRFIPAPSPNLQPPIVQYLRSLLETATVKSKSIPPVPLDHPHFALGMQVKDGVAKRLEWKALLTEIARADAVTANTNSSISSKSRQQFLFDLSPSIANSVYDLLKDESCEDEDARTYVVDVFVWPDAQNARKAIINEVVSTFRRMPKSDVQQSYRFPVVTLATGKAAFLEPYQVRGDHE